MILGDSHMIKRKGGQKKGYLGHRSHGRGNVKNRRGSGNRGGRGMAGIDKHKWSWAMVNEPNYFGKHGFSRPTGTKVAVPVVNLFEINQQAIHNKLDKKGGKFHFEFKGKVLATGNVTVPLSIKATAWSKNVEKKVGDAGGDISKLETPKAS
jgi:large subunit ribosomal protein L15